LLEGCIVMATASAIVDQPCIVRARHNGDKRRTG
jgi:hypothetical protein